MGIVMVKATYVFRDTYDPDALRSKVLLWGGISLGLGVTIHVVDTLFKICFGITGEHLTRQLRVEALRQLLRACARGAAQHEPARGVAQRAASSW